MKKIWNQYSYAIFLIILSCSLALLLSIRFHSINDEKFLTITVTKGDSLWQISNQYSNQHSFSNKDFVRWVKKHNNINGDRIFPGEEIIIPVSLDASSSTELASAADE